MSGTDRIVIDPNKWSEDGATALAEWAPSEDGTHLAYTVQEGGTDWRTIRVLDVESGAILDDKIKWARFTNIAWAKDSSGFFYSRNPEPESWKDASIASKAGWPSSAGPTTDSSDAMRSSARPRRSLCLARSKTARPHNPRTSAPAESACRRHR